MSHSQIRCVKLILRHAWLNLCDKHMTTGRINQVSTAKKLLPAKLRKAYEGCSTSDESEICSISFMF